MKKTVDGEVGGSGGWERCIIVRCSGRVEWWGQVQLFYFPAEDRIRIFCLSGGVEYLYKMEVWNNGVSWQCGIMASRGSVEAGAYAHVTLPGSPFV